MPPSQLDLFPDPIDRALALRADGDFAGAIDLLYATLADDLTQLSVLSVLASMLAENEQFDRAERLFQRALAAGAPSPTLLHNYATFLSHSGRPKAGIEAFGDAMAGQLTRVRVDLRVDDIDSARREFDALGGIECMFARSLLVAGCEEAAFAMARRWLTSESTWEQASDIVFAAWEALGRDEMVEMATLHARSQASPSMVAELGDAAASASGDDFDAFATFARGGWYLFSGWEAVFDTPLFLRYRLCLKPKDTDLAGAIVSSNPLVAQLDPNSRAGSERRWQLIQNEVKAAKAMAARLRASGVLAG